MSKQRGVTTTKADDHLVDVAKSQTAFPLGFTAGAKGDFLERIIIVPETTGAGTIALLDGNVSRNIFVAGTLADLSPITIDIGARSVVGPWNITTGDNVHVIAIGTFS